MSFWDPINKILNSSTFKTIFPVQAIAQGATKAFTGLDPAQQYATGGTVGSGIAGLHALMGPAASGMSPYMPTSTPNMGAAGSTLGPGGMFSPLNPMGTSMGPQTAGGTSSILKLMRMMPSGGNQQPQDNGAMQRQNHEMQMRLIYQMFPNLKPGSPLGTGGI